MIWPWWLGVAALGLALGTAGAFATGGARVFMKTLAIPLAVILARALFPHSRAAQAGAGYILIDIVLLAVFALAADYVVGLRLGRHDRQGFRHDSVGH